MRQMQAATQKLFEATTEKLLEIRESFGKRITGIEVKVADNEKPVDGKLVMMEEEINNLQSQRPEPVRVVFESAARIKPPSFDCWRYSVNSVTSTNRNCTVWS